MLSDKAEVSRQFHWSLLELHRKKLSLMDIACRLEFVTSSKRSKKPLLAEAIFDG
jgi:hypothetical protein